MSKYNVEIASPAANMYESLARPAAREQDGRARIALLQSIDRIIEETIPSSPFSAGIQLYGQLKGLYWVRQEPVHIFYEIPSFKLRTVSIVSILVGLPSAEQKADAIMTHMMLSGRFQVLPQGAGSRHLAAN
jgi:hypothetical protein